MIKWLKLALLSFVSSAAISIMAITLLTDDPSGSLNEWLYRWQTGLAGIGAVIAAYLTVRTMEATDARAQIRHDQLLAIPLITDRLKLRRANARFEREIQPCILIADDAAQLLQKHLAAHLEFRRQNVPSSPESQDALSKAVDASFQLIGSAMQVLRELDHPDFKDAAALFGPSLSFDFNALIGTANRCLDGWYVEAKVGVELRPGVDAAQLMLEDVDVLIYNQSIFMSSADMFFRYANFFHEGLQRLIAKYPSVIDAD